MSSKFVLEDALVGQNERFTQYMSSITRFLGHQDRHRPFEDYCQGLMLSGERKSVEPLAARLRPASKDATHQSLLHFVGQAAWSDEAVLKTVCTEVLPDIQRHGKIRTWIIDDTGMPKKGKASVGVAHQYCGNLGKQANCQVAVSLSLANDFGSIPVAYRLYLPEDWAHDEERRASTKIPKNISFQTKIEIALEQVRTAYAIGLPQGTVIADAAYGNSSVFRMEIAKIGLRYCVAIQSNTGVWYGKNQPEPPPKRKAGARGRPYTRHRRTETRQPQSVMEVAQSLPESAYRKVTWRSGSKEELASRFACIRVRTISRFDAYLNDEEMLLIEWPEHEIQPRKYWLANFPATISRKRLVEIAQSRWRIERDYQELKDELGLDHYEGRSWRGFHHHATLCIAAYGFLIKEKSAALAGDFSPSGIIRQRVANELENRLPPRSIKVLPRGAGRATRAAYSNLDHFDAPSDCADDHTET